LTFQQLEAPSQCRQDGEGGMNIGEIAAESGVPAKTIRYYEEVGLIAPAPRRTNGYRRYDGIDLHTLRFIHHARRLGFSVNEVRDLLALWRDRRRASADVKRLALAKIGEIDRKIDELAALRRTLRDLAERCHGDGRPECPILDEMAGTTAALSAGQKGGRP
jgi:MerR family transcriptional regulator, copper efflux regulator